jgi:hypothetical protein
MALLRSRVRYMAEQGIANPDLEDEDVASLTSLNIVANRAPIH